MSRGTRRLRLACVAAALALGLTACGSGNIKNTQTSSSGKNCGDLRIAVNPWTGYVANAHVIGYVAKTKLGCNVTYPDVKEEVGWQGMASGSIDTIVENWGHPDLVKKYIDQQKTVEDAGLTGNDGIIGWYVPPWMAQKYPDITNWKNLNKYANLFADLGVGRQGPAPRRRPVVRHQRRGAREEPEPQLQGRRRWISEAALIQSFRSAEKDKKPLLAYFYEPQWFFSEMKLVKVNLPPYKAGCDSDPAKVACDYPPYKLNKLIATKFAKSGSPAVDLIKKFQWTNDDQNLVATYIAKNNMSPEDAAKKWVDANPDKVKAWLG